MKIGRYAVVGLIFSIWMSLWGCQKDKSAGSAPAAAPGEGTAVAAGELRNVSVEEAYQFIQQHPEALVIDVRTPQEYTGPLGHIPGAQLKPVQQIDRWAKEIAALKDRPIVLVCRSGNRSSYAANYLKAQGFQQLLNVQGGMMAWNRKGLPVEK